MRALGWVICSVAMFLPWRPRILYAELLGWIVQFLYWTYYGILNYLLQELRKVSAETKHVR